MTRAEALLAILSLNRRQREIHQDAELARKMVSIPDRVSKPRPCDNAERELLRRYVEERATEIIRDYRPLDALAQFEMTLMSAYPLKDFERRPRKCA